MQSSPPLTAVVALLYPESHLKHSCNHPTPMLDPDPWPSVAESLADPDWAFRTIPGLARDTGLAPDDVQAVLREHAADVRCAALPDKRGNTLYTLAQRRLSFREVLYTAQRYASKGV